MAGIDIDNTVPNISPSVNNAGSLGTDVKKWARIRATEIVSGDYCWDDEACAICEKQFAVGDIIDLRIHKIKPDSTGRRISYGVPVHRTCG